LRPLSGIRLIQPLNNLFPKANALNPCQQGASMENSEKKLTAAGLDKKQESGKITSRCERNTKKVNSKAT